MKKGYILMSGLFNFILGYLFFFVGGLLVLSFIYVADSMNLIWGDTEEGMLSVIVSLTFIGCLIYFPSLLLGNAVFRKKLQLKKRTYFFFATGTFLLGLSFFLFLMK